jgi:hypothetical protein
VVGHALQGVGHPPSLLDELTEALHHLIEGSTQGRQFVPTRRRDGVGQPPLGHRRRPLNYGQDPPPDRLHQPLALKHADESKAGNQDDAQPQQGAACVLVLPKGHIQHETADGRRRRGLRLRDLGSPTQEGLLGQSRPPGLDGNLEDDVPLLGSPEQDPFLALPEGLLDFWMSRRTKVLPKGLVHANAQELTVGAIDLRPGDRTSLNRPVQDLIEGFHQPKPDIVGDIPCDLLGQGTDPPLMQAIHSRQTESAEDDQAQQEPQHRHEPCRQETDPEGVKIRGKVQLHTCPPVGDSPGAIDLCRAREIRPHPGGHRKGRPPRR